VSVLEISCHGDNLSTEGANVLEHWLFLFAVFDKTLFHKGLMGNNFTKLKRHAAGIVRARPINLSQIHKS